jgi:hypothetical protein
MLCTTTAPPAYDGEHRLELRRMDVFAGGFIHEERFDGDHQIVST